MKFNVQIMVILQGLLHNWSFCNGDRILKHTWYGLFNNSWSCQIFFLPLFLITEFFWLILVLFQQPVHQSLSYSVFFGNLSLCYILCLVLFEDHFNISRCELTSASCLVFSASRFFLHPSCSNLTLCQAFCVALWSGMLQPLSWASVW